jgi:transposase-like protein
MPMTHSVKSLLTSTQKTVSEWAEKIRATVKTKEQERANYLSRKQQLLPDLIDAHEKGVSSRELERITGINHTTICRWVKEARKKKQQDDTNVSTK